MVYGAIDYSSFERDIAMTDFDRLLVKMREEEDTWITPTRGHSKKKRLRSMEEWRSNRFKTRKVKAVDIYMGTTPATRNRFSCLSADDDSAMTHMSSL